MSVRLYPGAVAIAVLAAARGYRSGSLDPSGAAAAALLGYSALANPLSVFGVCLLGFYLAGSRATKVRCRVVSARIKGCPIPPPPCTKLGTTRRAGQGRNQSDLRRAGTRSRTGRTGITNNKVRPSQSGRQPIRDSSRLQRLARIRVRRHLAVLLLGGSQFAPWVDGRGKVVRRGGAESRWRGGSEPCLDSRGGGVLGCVLWRHSMSNFFLLWTQVSLAN